MDFQKLLKEADYNKVKASQEASVERYNSDLPPPKKVPKSSVKSDGIRRFLEKKKAEEEARAAEAQKQKEKLLALRAQNSKNSKKAKIMASRTKDNDFSKIKLTDDEIEAKKKREAVLIRQNLANKVERMKARIEMEEKEALLPRKRKRKSKNGEVIASHDDPLPEVKNDYRDSKDCKNNDNERVPDKSNIVKKKVPKPPQTTLSFSDLLKIAEKKQHEPLEIAVPQKDDDKLMTKKQRKLMQEEQERLKRKKEREYREKIEKEMEEKRAAKYSRAPNVASSKPKSGPQTANVNKRTLPEKSKDPVVVRVEKHLSKPVQEASKFKIPKGTTNTPISKNVPVKAKETISTNTVKPSIVKPNSASLEKSFRSNHTSEQKKPINPKVQNGASFKDMGNMKKLVVPKKNGLKVNPVSSAPAPKQPAPAPQVDEVALEQRIREKLEREIEARIAAKFGLHMQNLNSQDKAVNNKVPETLKPSVKKETAVINQSNKKVPDKPTIRSQKDIAKLMAMKKQAMEQKNLARKLPEKKPFHKNPYLDPPRRLLEPQRPRGLPPKRRIESDDEDDDDDDMSDFIDDGPSQNEDDYSKYIQEIFGYDRNKYVDNDDDDIMETSFAEQMKEEIQSAKAGYLEDLEEEKKEQARRKKKKLKK